MANVIQRLFQFARKADGEQIKENKQTGALDYWKLQDIANDEHTEITVRMADGREVVIKPQVDDGEQDYFDERRNYAW